MNGQQLKNSILQMAVQGKLVPQDPNDEPASVLIQRIRTEKEKLIKEKKIKKEKNPSYIFRGSDNLHYEKVGDADPKCIEDQLPFEIPNSWEWVRLGSVSTYAEKKSKINASEAPKDAWGLDLEDIEKGGRLLKKLMIGERKAVGDKTHFSRGDILYSKLRPYLLKILVAPDDGYCSPEIIPFSMFGGIIHEYIVQYLRSPHVNMTVNQITYGVKMPRVGTETMVSQLCPIPPLAEQQRIVAKIEQILPHIKEYELAETKIVQLNIAFPEQLKKSILQEAVQGKLVPQDPTDEPASVLLDRIREEKARLIKEGKIKKDKNESVIFRRDNSYYEKSNGVERCIDKEIPFEIPDNWCWTRIKNIINVVSARRVHQSDWKSEGIPFYRAREIGKLSELDFVHNELFISKELYSEFAKSGVPVEGDLMITAVGTLGKVYIVKKNDQFYYKDASVICFENYGKLNSQYLKIVIQSPFFSELIKKKSAGTTVNTITISNANEYLIPLPPLSEQRRIIQRMEIFNQWCKSL